jgi:hypothetical protein
MDGTQQHSSPSDQNTHKPPQHIKVVTQWEDPLMFFSGQHC